jgi:parallel beta-helix repeat protein
MGTFALAFNVVLVHAQVPETVYINSDGSITPSSAPISSVDNVNYTFTGNMSYPAYYGVVVERSNIVIDGNGYTVQGNSSSTPYSLNYSGNGLSLTGISNVTIENANIENFHNGIYLSDSNNNIIRDDNATANEEGIYLDSSSNNIVSGNTATGTNNATGIYLVSSNYNTVVGNNATANVVGILLQSSNNNTVSGNTATANTEGININSSNNNTVSGNTATANKWDGIDIYSSSNNNIYHNNFIGNAAQASVDSTSAGNAWDNGYPSGGNYWSDYNGTDLYSGQYQNMTGSDGIGDTPYFINANNTDHYPLMRPWLPPAQSWPPPSPSFWVIPATETFYTSKASVGTLFNVTVMASAVNGTDFWSVQLGFNASQLQVVASGFSAGATSQLFAGHDTVPLGPLTDNVGTTAGYPGVGSVEMSETLLGSDYVAAANASVFYVTFNVTAVPAAGQTLSSLIDPAFGLNTSETLFILQSPTTAYPTGEITNPNTAPCTYSFVSSLGSPSTVYINADGSISPAGAPIVTSDNVTYTFTGNMIFPIYNGVVVERNNTVIDGNGYTMQGNGSVPGIPPPWITIYSIGLNLNGTSNVTVQNTNIRSFVFGISLSGSNNNVISNNNLTDNSGAGIYLVNSSNNTVGENNLTSNGIGGVGGIWLNSSSYNTVSGNNATANYDGIALSGSSNIVSGNIATADYNYGIYLADSSNDTVSENDASANFYGIYLWASSNNAINGNNVTANSYGIYLYTSSNNNIVSENNASANSAKGILLFGSSNTTVNGNTATANNYGIFLIDSSNNTVSSNNATTNSYGLYLFGSANNTLSSNNVTANGDDGIYLCPDSMDSPNYTYYSSNNTLIGNNITANGEGILFQNSSYNMLYHNNFVGNTVQASVDSASVGNAWDNGYPSGGNYWSDYNGTDLYSGQYQNVTGSDGIGDTPYVINANNTDHYPLMTPVTIVPEFPEPLILATFMLATLLTIVIHKKRHSRF